MKKVLLSFLLTLLPMLASAETVEIDGIWYNLITKINEAEVTRNPNINDNTGSYSGSVAFPPSITHNGVTYNVTKIGNNAFKLCTNLNSITIPSSVKTIGDWAFYYCNALTSITIPNSVTSIGEYAFYQCSALSSIAIPNGVTKIESYTFSYCNSLESVTIPNSVSSIEIGAFSGCNDLTSINIPQSVTSIGSSAFNDCSALTSVSIPNKVTIISFHAFKGCSALTSFTIPNNVTKISDEAFANCSNLTDVYCLAEKIRNEEIIGEGLYTYADAFKESYLQGITLHVPASSIEAYRSMEPWKSFGNIVTIEDGDIPATQKCATPTISFNNGKVSFTCETEGAEFVSEVKASDAKLYYDSEYTLSQKYTISVYATKTGYDNSDTVTRDIIITGDGKAIIVGDVDGDGKVNVADHVELSKIILNQ